MANKDSVTFDFEVDPDFNEKAGLVCVISWERLEQLLIATGELHEGEKLTGATVTNKTIKYYVKMPKK